MKAPECLGRVDDKGITLIELLIVIAIIGILAVALGFSYVGWMGRYQVEKTTKNIYSDLMTARARAMQRNRMHFVRFPVTTSYTIYEDDSNGVAKIPDGDGILQEGTGITADTQLASFPKTLEYAVTIGTVAGVPPITFNLDSRGTISPERTICIFTDADGDGISDTDPDYDCIIISQTRIITGKLTTQNTAGGICGGTPNNCVTK